MCSDITLLLSALSLVVINCKTLATSMLEFTDGPGTGSIPACFNVLVCRI